MIIKITNQTDFDLSDFDLDEILIDVDKNGVPLREIGLKNGMVVHRYPSTGKYGRYGIFDLNKFDLEKSSCSNEDDKEFEVLWKKM